ncbi:hypothetical protein KR038_004940 [Drosophila bunnanda]|nr:hypothetical protein KR038_004940 [Drosophila bunnanda]
MANQDILPIFPSRANSVVMKQRVLAARRGVGLLKRKRDAIDMKLRELKRYLLEKDEEVDQAMGEAIFSMAKARLLGADFKPQIVSSSKVDAVNIRRTQTKIVGVTLNCLELEVKSGVGTGFPLAGLSVGGSQVNRIREKYTKALLELVATASIIVQVRMLEAASLQTNMRVNALEHVVIPVLQNTSTYITGELEEFEREDFYRLKRSQAKQMEAKLAFTELIKTKNMTAEELAFYSTKSTGINLPKADIHFDAEEFDAAKVKERLREARASLSHTNQPSNNFAISRSTMTEIQRSRDPSVGNVDLYSTKRMILEGPRRSSQMSKETFLRRVSLNAKASEEAERRELTNKKKIIENERKN